MKIKKPKIKVARNIIKTASVSKTNPVKTTIKKRKDTSANLGKYLHAKLPDRSKKIGGNVKLISKRKLTRTKAQYGVHDV